jgi:hypothetical protein
MQNIPRQGFNDRVIGKIINNEGKKITSYTYSCFGGTFSDGYKELIRDNKNHAYQFYFVDALTQHTKSTEASQKFIDELVAMGGIRNSTVELASYKHEEWVNGSYSCAEGTPIIVYTLPFDTVSSTELFLVGQCIRLLAVNPQIVLDFFKLREVEPELESSIALQLAHSISFSDERRLTSGQVLLQEYTTVLTNKTFNDFYNEVVQTPIRKASSYKLVLVKDDPSSFVDYNRYFCKSFPTGNIKYDGRIQSTYVQRREGCKYSKEALATYFDTTLYLENIYNPKVLRNPYVNPTEVKQFELV